MSFGTWHGYSGALIIVCAGSRRPHWFGQLSFADYMAQYQLSQWCSQCHTRYDAPRTGYPAPSPGSTDSGDSIFKYRHMVRYDYELKCSTCHPSSNGTMAAPDPFNVGAAVAMEVTCQSCHVAHGSSAQMGAYSGSVAWPDAATAPNGNHRSSLLRLDNRGVCVACHANKAGFQP